MGQPARGPDYGLATAVGKLQKQVQALSTRDVLQNATISNGGLTVDSGGSITVTGGGTVTVNGLALSAVHPAGVFAQTSGFAVSTSLSIVCSKTVAVPAGFTTAIINITGSLNIANDNAGIEYGYIEVAYQATGQSAVASGGFDIYLAGGGTGSGAVGLGGVISGLSDGQEVAVATYAQAGAALAANGYNASNVTGSVIFLP